MKNVLLVVPRDATWITSFHQSGVESPTRLIPEPSLGSSHSKGKEFVWNQRAKSQFLRTVWSRNIFRCGFWCRLPCWQTEVCLSTWTQIGNDAWGESSFTPKQSIPSSATSRTLQFLAEFPADVIIYPLVYFSLFHFLFWLITFGLQTASVFGRTTLLKQPDLNLSAIKVYTHIKVSKNFTLIRE